MNKIEKLYKELHQKYGKPTGQWKLWCKRPKTEREKEEIIIGAILTQRANWNNAEMAIQNLKKAGVCSLQGICNLAKKNKSKLYNLIKPSGFYQQKGRRLFEMSKAILKTYSTITKMERANTAELRRFLLNLHGIGQETADDILLYALEKPVFVIDEYTKRLVRKRKLADNLSYDFLQELFENNLKKDFELYQDFHALIITEGKTPSGQKLLFKN